MTDQGEIEALADAMEDRGAIVRLIRINGLIQAVQIVRAKGIGPHPMSLISATERMREWLMVA